MNTIIDIIVINWNSGVVAAKAIQPYLNAGSSRLLYNVIIVDNASSDNSIEILSSSNVKIIKNKQNYGFGNACNQALAECKGKYILLLNPDTISTTHTLETLVSFLEENEKYGVVGPRQVDENNNTIKTCGRFPGFITTLYELTGLSKFAPTIFTPVPIMIDWTHDKDRDVDHVMGSYMLIKRSIIDAVGFMDNDYFVYMEDIDLSKRIRNNGYKIKFIAEKTIFHKSGGSGKYERETRLFYYLSARQIYWRKHLSLLSCYFLTILSIVLEPFPRLIDAFLKTKSFQFYNILRAYYLYLKKILYKS